jgi:hypothetical protein
MRSGPAARALIATALLRIACSAFAFRFALNVGPNQELAAKNLLSNHAIGPAGGWRYLLFGIWERFDTLWYLQIASHGYDHPAATVFYPFYPFLIRCFSWFLREPVAAALLISTVATFFVFWGIQELALLDDSMGTSAVWAMVLIACWPAAFIFFAAYPESLVIALAIWSIYFARTDRWWLAAILAAFAGATKAAGVLVCVPLAVILLHERRWRALPALALAPLGFLSYAIWLRVHGFPPAAEVYAVHWKTTVSMPWETLWVTVRTLAHDPNDWLTAMNLLVLALFAVAICAAWKRRLDYLLFSCACLTMFLAKQSVPPLQSTARYVLLIFPAFLCWGRQINRPAAGFLILLLMFPLYLAVMRTFLWWGLIV